MDTDYMDTNYMIPLHLVEQAAAAYQQALSYKHRARAIITQKDWFVEIEASDWPNRYIPYNWLS